MLPWTFKILALTTLLFYGCSNQEEKTSIRSAGKADSSDSVKSTQKSSSETTNGQNSTLPGTENTNSVDVLQPDPVSTDSPNQNTGNQPENSLQNGPNQLANNSAEPSQSGLALPGQIVPNEVETVPQTETGARESSSAGTEAPEAIEPEETEETGTTVTPEAPENPAEPETPDPIIPNTANMDTNPPVGNTTASQNPVPSIIFVFMGHGLPMENFVNQNGFTGDLASLNNLATSITGLVHPVYRTTLINADGSETPLTGADAFHSS